MSGAGRVIVWVGASATAIGVMLASFGYLVESAYLTRFGVRRGVIDLGQNEYIVTGGQFLIGIPGLMVTGAIQLVVRCWYLIPVIAMICVVGRWRRLGPAFPWLAFAALHAVWLGATLSALGGSADAATARARVAMLTFTTVVALTYAWLARPSTRASTGSLAPPDAASAPRETGQATRRLLARAPYLAVLVMAVVMLPYVRGAYGELRDDAVIQLDPGEARLLCGLARGPDCTPEACRDEQWQLIAFGKDKVVLRNLQTAEVYVAPIGVAQTFRIRNREMTRIDRRVVP